MEEQQDLEEDAPSQSVSERHGRKMDEYADDVLPLVDNRRILESNYRPCLKEA